MSRKFSKDDVLHLAKLSCLGVTDKEAEEMANQLSEIATHYEKLQSVDTSLNNNEPLEQVLEYIGDESLLAFSRVDKVVTSITKEVALELAPKVRGSFFQVPTIIE
jgi:aspartyl-tRNA(Asn)/glutamyl-tRNA(Gln) amidotransferase subunit C